MSIKSFIRRIQGERPGMTAGAGWKWYGGYSAPMSILVENSIRIADVSYYQAAIDFAIMKAAGIYGVIIRAGQRNWVDSRFRENWGKAKQAGLPRGSYWLYDSREDPKKQAALWASLIQADPGELFHAADLEENYGGPYGKPEHIKTFLTEMVLLVPSRSIVIYTGFYWWADRMGKDPFYKIFGLWLPWYAPAEIVRLPEPWSQDDLFFWQYTSSGNGLAYGVSSKEIDLSWYCCSAADYSRQFHVTVDVPAPPAPGGPMWYRVNAMDGLNIREGHGTSYQKIGAMIYGDLVEVVDVSIGGWVKIKTWMRGGAALDLPNPADSWCSNAYLVAVDAPVPPVPPPPPDPVPSPFPAEIGVTIDGVTKQYVLKP